VARVTKSVQKLKKMGQACTCLDEEETRPLAKEEQYLKQRRKKDPFKLEATHPIAELTCRLIAEINKHQSSSAITLPVLDYLNELNELAGYYSPETKASLFATELQACFRLHGWRANSFYTEPSLLNLLINLQEIMNKYVK
jgi:hypothetical protein